MSSPFDEIIDRSNMNALTIDGYRDYLFPDKDPDFLPFSDDALIHMWVADMAFATPSFILDAIKRRLDRRILGYTRIFDSHYYQSFAKWTARNYGWQCEETHLVTANGIVPALYELVDYICGPEDQVLFVTPSYALFQSAVEAGGRTPIYSDLINTEGHFSLDFDDLELKMADAKTTLCIFCHPHNPTGRVWTQEELERFSALLRRYGLWVISDEVHCDLLRQGQTHTPLALYMEDYDRCITCMSPSKTFNLAGMMLSNIVIPNDTLRTLWKKCHHGSENPLSIAAVQAAYAQGEKWLDGLKSYLDDNFALTAQVLKSRLPKAVFHIPQATYLAWIDLTAYFPPGFDLSYFFAKESGVLLEGGNMFVQNADGFIRLNLACPKEVLEIGLERICDSVQGYESHSTSSFPKT